MCAAREMGAVLRVEKKTTQAHVQNLPLFLKTSWDKGAELLRITINVLFGETSSKYDSMFCFTVPACRGDDSCR